MSSSAMDLTELSPNATANEIARVLNDLACESRPFVRIGHRALVAVNLPQSLSFDPAVSAKYQPGSHAPPNRPPHVYEIATSAFNAMMATHKDQAIVVSGESGSGKSLAARLVGKHLCALSANSAKKSRVVSGVTKMETVLEAFVNASTVTNANSSRMGRYTEYQFDSRGKMAGVKVLDYLFDRDRVTAVPLREHNFHVFYLLLAGATEPERAEWHLSDTATFAYLNRAAPITTGATSSAQRERLDELRQHMKSLGMGTRTQALIFKSVMAVLFIGEIEFEDSQTGSANDPCQIKNREALEQVAGMLGVDTESLEYSLTFQTKLINRELCTVLLSIQAAKQQRDHLAKTLYSLIVRWLVEHINSRLTLDDCDACIGVLDFVSFRPGGINSDRHASFETFLVNAANERLAAYTFQRHRAFLHDLCNEGIVEFSSDLLKPPLTASDLIWSPDVTAGIMSILNVESQKLVGDTHVHETNMATHIHDVCSASTLYSPGQATDFSIKHYAGNVLYDFPGFIEHNRNMISADVVTLFRGNAETRSPPSINAFVRHLFSEENVATSKLSRSRTLISSGYQSGVPQRRASALLRPGREHLGQDPLGGDSSDGFGFGNRDSFMSSAASRRASRVKKSSAARAGLPPPAKIPLRVADLEAALDDLEDTLDAMDVWSIICISPSRSVGPIDWQYMAQQLTVMDVPNMVEIAHRTEPFCHSYAFADFAAAYRDAVVDMVHIRNASGYTDQMICDAAASGMALQGERGIRQGPNKIYLSQGVWSKFEAAKARAASGSLPAIAGQSRSQQLQPNRISDQTIESRIETGSNHGLVMERPASPSYTVDQFNADEVSFNAPLSGLEIESTGSAAGGGMPGVHRSGVAGNESSDAGGPETPSSPTSKPPPKKMTRQRCQWLTCTWFLTWWIPSCALSVCGKMRRPDIRMAWREKVALCIIIFFFCASLIFFIVGLGRILCPKQEVFSSFEIAGKGSAKDPWVYAYGRVYQISDLIANHQNSYAIPSFRFAGFLGGDVSTLFYAGNQFATYCPGLPPPQAGWDPIINRPRADANNYAHVGLDPATGTQKLYIEYMNKYARARLALSLDYIAKVASAERRLIVIHDNVYDVSGYFNADSRFFGPMVEQLFGNFFGRDATAQWRQIQSQDPKAGLYMQCMNKLFYVGTVDHRNDWQCQFSNYILLSSSIVVVAIIGFKFLAALQFGSSRDPEEHDKFVICQVPCYTEGSDSLSKTLESLAVMQYDDRRKLLFVIADGMIVGSGNDKPTPQIVLDILGVDPSVDPEPASFVSLGEGDMQHNMGKVYSGLFHFQGHAVPFVVVVKVGKPSERSKPGNRGKRDSQLILMRFLSRVHFNAEMAPLELDIFHHMKNIIGVHPSMYEYVLMVDADTEVMPDSLNKLVSVFMHDSKIMGLCGETLLSNEKESWITMIQVYEYFISHHLAKAFESLFGTVTCLPGCFCMYRVRTPLKNVPLLIAPSVINDYSENTVDTLHLKNLLHLGEDRYLTTLMLKHFPYMRTKFTPDAICKTNAPDRWAVLLSQRRRWINSTVHNLVELLFLEQMCGFCCFSMRFIVFMDLFSTIVQPAGILYIGYLIYTLVTSPDVFPLISIVMLSVIYGLQVIIFVLKRQWAQIGWMIVYLLAMPVFGFYIPLYSFWRFDNFSWGNTRVAVGDQAAGSKSSKQAIREFDPKSIPLRRWVDVDPSKDKGDAWETQSQHSNQSHASKTADPRPVVLGGMVASAIEARRPRGLKITIPQYGNVASGPLTGPASGLVSAQEPNSMRNFAASPLYTGLQSSSPVTSPMTAMTPVGNMPLAMASGSGGTGGGFSTGSSGGMVGGSLTPANASTRNDYFSHRQPASSIPMPAMNVTRARPPAPPSTAASGISTPPIPPSNTNVHNSSRSANSNSMNSHAMGVRDVPDQAIIAELRSVLASVDLMAVTKRQVRDMVSARLGVDLTPRKDAVNHFMDQILHGRL
ncbi:chitin synthase-domain-containing protein [Entophlyctis helioformis]|nr:chitin synthase-domain-containing protein [Entophlyctis helioformis]